MATQNQSLDADTIELLMVDYGIEAHQKVEVDTADIERFFVEDDYLNPKKYGWLNCARCNDYGAC